MNTALQDSTWTQQPEDVSPNRAVERLLAPLDELAHTSNRLLSKSLGQFESAGRSYSLPRYVYLGPKGGGDTIRLGIFATIHGDEPEGALGLGRFLKEALEKKLPNHVVA